MGWNELDISRDAESDTFQKDSFGQFRHRDNRARMIHASCIFLRSEDAYCAILSSICFELWVKHKVKEGVEGRFVIVRISV